MRNQGDRNRQTGNEKQLLDPLVAANPITAIDVTLLSAVH